ncbi:MAG: hypothetical protein ACI957_002666 [Verrucomicrobiales bacterium]|jgi:hypothetical protein
MGMEMLRTKSPEMVRKEVLMRMIAYNAIRLLMLKAGNQLQKSDPSNGRKPGGGRESVRKNPSKRERQPAKGTRKNRITFSNRSAGIVPFRKNI